MLPFGDLKETAKLDDTGGINCHAGVMKGISSPVNSTMKPRSKLESIDWVDGAQAGTLSVEWCSGASAGLGAGTANLKAARKIPDTTR